METIQSGGVSADTGIVFGTYRSGNMAPALDLLFAGATSLDPRISFSRGSIGTRVNSAGLIEAIAANQPRFDYDAVTLSPLGLLVEESRTNLLLNSTIDGANLGTQSVTVGATPYTLSFYGTGTVTLSGAATGTITGTGAYPSKKIYTFTPSTGSLTLTVSGAVQFSNLEAGSFETSFIPTPAATVTRAADVASMPTAGWFNGVMGTFVAQADGNAGAGGSAVILAASSNAAAGFNDLPQLDILTTGIRAYISNSTGSQYIAPSINGSFQGLQLKLAVSFNGSSASISVSAKAPSSAAYSFSPAPNLLNIGSVGTNQFLNGNIASLKFYPRTFSAAELQVATT